MSFPLPEIVLHQLGGDEVARLLLNAVADGGDEVGRIESLVRYVYVVVSQAPEATRCGAPERLSDGNDGVEVKAPSTMAPAPPMP